MTELFYDNKKFHHHFPFKNFPKGHRQTRLRQKYILCTWMGPWNAFTRPALGPLRWMACPAVVTTSVCLSPRTMSCVWLRLIRVGISTCFTVLRRQNKPSRFIPRRLCSLLPHTQREPSEPMIALHPEPALRLIASHRKLPTSRGRNLKQNNESR